MDARVCRPDFFVLNGILPWDGVESDVRYKTLRLTDKQNSVIILRQYDSLIVAGRKLRYCNRLEANYKFFLDTFSFKKKYHMTPAKWKENIE